MVLRATVSPATTMMRFPCRVVLGLCAVVFLAQVAPAQMPGSSQTGLNAAMLKLFAEIPAFTSKAEVRVQEKGGKEPMIMSVDFSMLDGNVRMDLDMNTLRSRSVPPATIAGYKAVGLDQVVTVIRPARKSALLIYPGVHAYVEMPMSKEEAADLERKLKVEKTRLARETIDGQACDKTRVIVSAENGDRHEALVWYSPALSNFPLKIQMDQQQMSVVMQYRDVKLVRPPASQFEPPAGFTKQPSMEQLMQAAMARMLGGRKP